MHTKQNTTFLQRFPHKHLSSAPHSLLNSNLVTPEIFVQFRSSIQKLLMIFLNTDRQAEIFVYPIISTSHKME